MKRNKILNMFFLLSLAVLSGNIQAQRGYAWKSVGKKTDTAYYNFKQLAFDNTLFQKRINGDLYIVTGSSYEGRMQVSKWSGTSWSKYPVAELPYAKVKDIGLFNGQVYLSGSEFEYVPMAQRPGDLPFAMVRFNGTKWEGLPGTPAKDSSGWDQFRKGFIDNLVTWNGRMYYFSHSFVYTRNAKHKLYEINSSGVHKLIKTYDDLTNDGTSIMLCVHNNKLVVGGAIFNRKDQGIDVSGLEFYDGTSFTRYEHSMLAGGAATLRGYRDQPPSGLLSLNDSMMVLVTNGISGPQQVDPKIILLKHGVFYKNLGNPSPHFGAYYINGIISMDRSIHVEFAFWDQHCYEYNLDSGKWFPWRNDKILIYSQSDERVYGFRYGWISSDSFQKQVPVDFVELVKGATISGRTFADINYNCSRDIADKVLKRGLIEFDNGTSRFCAYSDDSGKYETAVIPGSYDIRCYTPGAISMVSSCSKINIVTKNTDTTIKNINLPVHFSSSKNLAVSIDASMGFRARHGFTEDYILTGTNFSFKKDSLVIRLKYPSKCTFVKSGIQPFSHSGNELVFKFSNLEWSDAKRIALQFSTSVQTSKMDDRLEFQASVLNSREDSLMENNTDTLRQMITGAFDPNIKQSSPEGRVMPGLKKIKYVIHFQNTGNDTAYRVTVVDTITQKLGLRYLKVTSTSHPQSYSLRVAGKQTLIWEFDNILLPDSHRNEKASHGYVAFEAAIDAKLAEGDSIDNRAYIYFDYQKPVITNTALIILDSRMDIEDATVVDAKGLMLYPNPANALVNVVADKKYDQVTICLFNMLGQELSREKLEDGRTAFNLEQLPKGIYFVRMEGTLIGGKLVVE